MVHFWITIYIWGTLRKNQIFQIFQTSNDQFVGDKEFLGGWVLNYKFLNIKYYNNYYIKYYARKKTVFDDLIFEKFEKIQKRGSFQNGKILVYQRLTTPFFLTKATVGATNAFEKSKTGGLRYFSVSLVFQRLTHSKIIIHEKFVSNSW